MANTDNISIHLSILPFISYLNLILPHSTGILAWGGGRILKVRGVWGSSARKFWIVRCSWMNSEAFLSLNTELWYFRFYLSFFKLYHTSCMQRYFIGEECTHICLPPMDLPLHQKIGDPSNCQSLVTCKLIHFKQILLFSQDLDFIWLVGYHKIKFNVQIQLRSKYWSYNCKNTIT